VADGRTQSGKPTTALVQSAHVGGNAELFAQIMALHVPANTLPRHKVADVVKQVHARKNHSYFLVFELPRGKARRVSSVRRSPERDDG